MRINDGAKIGAGRGAPLRVEGWRCEQEEAGTRGGLLGGEGRRVIRRKLVAEYLRVEGGR